MGFISDLVETAFEIVEGVDSSLVEAITYSYAASAPTYDTATGLVTESTSDLSFNVIRTKIDKKETVNLRGNPDLEIRSDDRIFLLAANDIGRTPAIGDKLTTGGEELEIVGWLSVPGNSLYKVVCRRP